MSNTITLVIGNKNYSSWSLRPWLVLKRSNLAFDEYHVKLRQDDTKRNILRHSPSGLVPVAKFEDLVIWDSLAIAEFLAEQCPEKKFWPEDISIRAVARAVSAEMHSGFRNIRMEMPMDIISRYPDFTPSTDVRTEIDRIFEIWSNCRTNFGKSGPFLFGHWTIADAMFAPIVTRFRTYSVKGADEIAAYMDAVLSDPIFLEWEGGCETI